MNHKQIKEPPKRLLQFFRWYCNPDFVEDIEGDLRERYFANMETSDEKKAFWRFFRDVISLFRIGIIRPIRFPYPINDTIMFRQNFKISLRHLRKNKTYAFINIGGLALGMAVAMMIGLWLYDELSFNGNFENKDQIARVMQHRTIGTEKETWWSTMKPLADELRNTYGHHFKQVVRGSFEQENDFYFEGEKFVSRGHFFEPNAPEMLSFEMIKGTHSSLAGPSSIMLSESFAQTIFGEQDALGKTLEIGKTSVKVTGIYSDFPVNSSFNEIDFIGSWELYETVEPWITQLNNPWGMSGFLTLVQLDESADFKEVESNISQVVFNNSSHDKSALAAKPEVFLHPMSKWYLLSRFENGVNTGGRIDNVWLFGIIGIFVLILACINFMNLSTARSEKRAKEVGVRKTIGSGRGQLIGQFYSESVMISLFAFVLSLGLVQLFLPWFNGIADKEMSILWSNPLLWLSGLAFILITGLLAGSYPALYLSSFNPVSTLKGSFKVGRMASMPRKALVVVQFTVSVTLIIGVMMVYKQIQFVKDRPVGYNQENLLMLFVHDQPIYEHFEAVKDGLFKTNLVAEVARSLSPITRVWQTNGDFKWKGKDPNVGVDFPNTGVAHDFGKTIDWEIIEGRDFSKELASDSAAFIVNEEAVKFMGLENPVGEVVKWDDRPYTIVGVIKNMIVESPYHPTRPHFYHILRHGGHIINVKLKANAATEKAITAIETVLKLHSPDLIMDYVFIDEDYNRKFRNEERMGKLMTVFALLAIIISCLGLFGLASYVAEKRTKEIGIRKILGASVSNLWLMLSKDFIILILISSLLSAPIAYHYVSRWIAHSDFQTTFPWWIFVLASVLALVITILTVSFQAIKAATTNPVSALKAE